MATSLGLLTVHFPTYWYAAPVAVIMCREIAVSALREWMAERRERATVEVGSLGKIKTALQMIATGVLLLVNPETPTTPIRLFGRSCLSVAQSAAFIGGMALLYLSTVLTVLSGVGYFKAAWPRLVGGAEATATTLITSDCQRNCFITTCM